MEYGRIPADNIFVNGDYALMLGSTFNIELFFNEEFNNRFNGNVQLVHKPEFPIKILFISYDGSKTQNMRNSSIAINANTKEKELAVDILNFILSEEYAFKIIESMPYYSHFANTIFDYPTFYNENTIAKLNESYSGSFDISVIYNVEYGNVMSHEPQFNRLFLIDEVLNSAFTEVFNN